MRKNFKDLEAVAGGIMSLGFFGFVFSLWHGWNTYWTYDLGKLVAYGAFIVAVVMLCGAIITCIRHDNGVKLDKDEVPIFGLASMIAFMWATVVGLCFTRLLDRIDWVYLVIIGVVGFFNGMYQILQAAEKKPEADATVPTT